MKNTEITSTPLSLKPSDSPLIRTPYKRTIKVPSPLMQSPENYLQAQSSGIKLPRIENSSYSHTYQEQVFKSKLGVFIDMGLSPNIPLSYKNILMYNNAKKKTITISDFMSKSVQKQILSSHFFRNIQEEENVLTKKIEKKKDSENCIGGKNTRSFRVLPISSYQDLNVLESPVMKKRDKIKDLKKIDGIILSCEKFLDKKPGDKKKKRFSI